MTFEIADKSYRFDFHHIRRGSGKKCRLHQGPVKAVSVCVLVCQDRDSGNIVWTASELALCSEQDDFSKRAGRIQTVDKLLRYSGALRGQPEIRQRLQAEYLKADPPPCFTPPPPRRKLTAEEKSALCQSGWEVREGRRQKRMAGRA